MAILHAKVAANRARWDRELADWQWKLKSIERALLRARKDGRPVPRMSDAELRWVSPHRRDL